ncbi:PREDICTED: cilia- and flagella-associated protein 53 [Myotis brandtii]|uniref:cilia- and flagella-associated protein 53 n=1 Tax=Myotis brandtii TaxID=109478 RepID=UPI00070430F0|nr:PREDICTED: cilia- and flagella-associated protein 53 [Myotis brandtii]
MVTMVTGSTSAPPTCPARLTMATGHLCLRSWFHRLQVAPLGNCGRRRTIPRGDSKMYSQRFGIVQREVKGPTPKVVMVRAKPPGSQRAEQQLERILRNYQKHHAILDSIKSIERERLKVDWCQHNDRKFVGSLVKARMKDAMQGFIINTEERRNKPHLLSLVGLGHSLLAAEKMLERCEELRTELLSIHEKKVCEERKAQVAFNEELKRQKLVEEQMFCKLWEEDRLAKERREAGEARRQKKLVENTRLGLNAQLTDINARRQAAQRLKEEEARLVEDERAQVKFENEQDKIEKQRTKQKLRTTLQKALQEKIERLQQEYREEQDLSTKLVQMAQQDLQDEADQNKQKREDRIKEQKIYHQYLAQQREEENAQEKELDRILEEEKAKQWAEKDKQLKLEKEARKQLMNEVMCTRKLQVQEKLQRKAKELEERALEKEHIQEGLKELNREEEENFVRRSGLAQEYQKELQMQMSYQQQAREAQKEEERRELEAGRAADKRCQDKIQELLCHSQVQLRNIHPMRRACPAKPPP